ncbi:MAG: LPXTG cell wall anchor domain-containing protein [Bifidobacteriaceae bacterium]|jgi:LPXTG-motif cell wall-anchored protein|nr:LPXTG cell wall anchor domain-containing protein [Bifidobacteriaceae bacterium]
MRRLSVRLAVVLAVAGIITSLGLTAAAALGPGQDPQPRAESSQSPVYLEHEWDGETVQLDWTGRARPVQRDENEFLGSVTAIPGDVVTRTLTVHNAGPGDATLTMELVDALTVSRPPSDPSATGPIQIVWQTPSASGTTPLADVLTKGSVKAFELPLAQDGDLKLTIGWTFPADATGSMGMGAVSFGMRLVLRGDLGGSSQNPSRTATSQDPSGTTSPPPGDDELPITGTSVGWLSLFGVTLTVIGILALIGRRRAAEEDEEDQAKA